MKLANALAWLEDYKPRFAVIEGPPTSQLGGLHRWQGLRDELAFVADKLRLYLSGIIMDRPAAKAE